jgi:hypothetical protein
MRPLENARHHLSALADPASADSRSTTRSTSTSSPHPPMNPTTTSAAPLLVRMWPHLSRAFPFGLLLMVSMLAGCDKYEPRATIEGMYYPNGSVHLEGRRAGLLWPSTTQVTISRPIRVSELGVMTYGWEVRQPGWTAEVGRLEFSDADVFIVAERLTQTGRFEYREREPTLHDWIRNHHIKVAMLTVLAVILIVIFVQLVAAENARRARKREQIEAEAAAENARRARERERREAEAAAKAAAQCAALARLRQLGAEAQNAAIALPIILGGAEMALDRAQDELRARLFSPFWEAVEEATMQLAILNQMLMLIEERKTAYHAQAAELDGCPAFSLGVSVLPDPGATQRRLISLYREAQSNPDYAKIYEQRRTNAILIAGFGSLGQAIERLGDRAVGAISGLAASLNYRLVSLESSLESAATAAAEQSAALRAELQRSNEAEEAVLATLRQDAEARSESERLALRMLDNIQRRREPTMWDRP